MKSRGIALILFFVALVPRLLGLGRFLTTDESYFIFSAGSNVISAFLRGDLRDTYWHFYPGVTLSWLEAMGMTGQYLLATLSGHSIPPFTEYIYGDVLSLLVANRLPFVILAAVAVPAIYLLARKLLPERIALLGALFMAFDPFYLAHSRVAHGDAPVTVFMSLSALAFFIYVERLRNPAAPANPQGGGEHASGQAFTLQVKRSSFYLIFSAVLGSLAALTKAPGQFMPLFIVGVSIIYAGLDLWQAKNTPQPTANPHQGRDTPPGARKRTRGKSTHTTRNTQYLSPLTPPVSRIILGWLTVIIIWGLVSLAVFVMLWPSMWVDPIGTFRQVWTETFGKVNEGHLVYFFGQATLDPGLWFYLYVIPFRMTPIILIGSVLSLLLLVAKTNLKIRIQNPEFRTFIFLWLFTISLLLFGNLSPKKQDRYLLPLFPFLNLLAAIGWLGLFDLSYYFIRRKLHLTSTNSALRIVRLTSRIPDRASLISGFAVLVLLLLHFRPVFTYYPYYLTYFNPLMGGPTRAAETTLMGWGEGMEQVAAYLNTKPNAGSLYVAATPSQTLLPYFAGTGENFYTNDIAFRADYVVLYLAQMQRLAPSPEIVRYFEAQQPEKIITIKDVPYAKIYPGPKLILPDIPPDATPANIGLADIIRLAGYKIQNPQLTLYWHALEPLSVNYTISVRARAADGRLLAQQDSWPVDGLLPTSQLRQGDYLADTHTLEISGPDIEQVSNFEVVVYNAETGETLGPPIMLSINN